jgi:hypothetical protein
MFMAALVMFFYNTSSNTWFIQRKISAFLQGLAGFRPLVTFVRDDIAKILERNNMQYMPYCF